MIPSSATRMCFHILLCWLCSVFVSAIGPQNIPTATVGNKSKNYCSDKWGNFRTVRSKLLGGGGIEALKGKYPFMAALGYGTHPNFTWACGGTLISLKYVMTAAHCTTYFELGEVKLVRLGVVELNFDPSEEIPQDINVTKIFRHPDFRPPLVYNVIALLELATLVELTHDVRPACLHTESVIKDSKWIATGWGAMFYGGPAADHLQELHLREYSHEECGKAYNSNNRRRLNRGIENDTQICAGEVGRDVCSGDSGGPLQIHHPEFPDAYSIIGITSFGKPCLITVQPGVYTRVSHYIKWIESIVWK